MVSPRVRSQRILDVVARSLDASGHVRPERLERDLAALQAACKTARVRLEFAPEVARRLGALRAAREWRRKTEQLNPDSSEVKRALDRLRVSLHPYQKEGVVFAVRGRRVLLGDEMGLGKTLQAIGAALLLREMGEVERVLVLCPASLKRQWQSEVERRAGEPARIIEGLRPEREAIYAEAAPLFTIANYELVYRDLEALRALKPELIVLDEAQRTKNWDTKTARAVSRLESRFAIVLTGTPLENRLEELHSLFRVVDSRALGPL